MDPNANLTAQRRLCDRIRAVQDTEPTHDVRLMAEQVATLAQYGTELAELVESLDAWITAGGFLPGAWTANRA